MKELELEFEGTGEVKNTLFKQLDKSELGYFYELTDLTDNEKRYEVFEKVEQKESESVFNGVAVKYEAKIKYPKSNDFGKFAWCFTNYDRAKEKFNNLQPKNERIQQ